MKLQKKKKLKNLAFLSISLFASDQVLLFTDVGDCLPLTKKAKVVTKINLILSFVYNFRRSSCFTDIYLVKAGILFCFLNVSKVI